MSSLKYEYACYVIVLKVLFCKRLEEREVEDESGATATALFLRDDTLFVAHVGDSCLVCATAF